MLPLEVTSADVLNRTERVSLSHYAAAQLHTCMQAHQLRIIGCKTHPLLAPVQHPCHPAVMPCLPIKPSTY